MYGVRTGWANNGLRVTNGTIRQSQTAGSFSHAIYVSSGSYDQFDNLTLEVYTDSSAPLVALYGTGHQVHHNSVISHVQTIQDRHQNQGYSIQLWDGGSNDVHDNTIVGGPQGGIFFYHSNNTRVYDNDISQGGQSIGYSNDFCIGGSGDNAEVFRNNCHPVQGRGMHIGGNGAKAYDNTINVIELPNNAEYGGCQAGGTYGIQIEHPATNLQIYNNTVIARADACAAQAFRASGLYASNGNRVYSNSFTAQRVGAGTGVANAVSLASVDTGLTIESNTLSGDSANFHVDWEGSNGTLLKNNVIVKGSNPSSIYATVNFGNGSSFSSLGNILQDSTYQNGADDASYRVRTAGFEYTVQWTLSITSTDTHGTAVGNASVTITDSTGATAFTGTTNASGVTSAVLREYRRYNQSGTNYVQSFNPYTVTVSKAGYGTSVSSVTVDQAKSISPQLTGDATPPAGVTDLRAQ
jgi:parallel beta-helix repeat protein